VKKEAVSDSDDNSDCELLDLSEDSSKATQKKKTNKRPIRKA